MELPRAEGRGGGGHGVAALRSYGPTEHRHGTEHEALVARATQDTLSRRTPVSMGADSQCLETLQGRELTEIICSFGARGHHTLLIWLASRLKRTRAPVSTYVAIEHQLQLQLQDARLSPRVVLRKGDTTTKWVLTPTISTKIRHHSPFQI